MEKLIGFILVGSVIIGLFFVFCSAVEDALNDDNTRRARENYHVKKSDAKILGNNGKRK